MTSILNPTGRWTYRGIAVTPTPTWIIDPLSGQRNQGFATPTDSDSDRELTFATSDSGGGRGVMQGKEGGEEKD